MSTEGGAAEEPTTPGSVAGSTPGSPRNKVKFLCSRGGKILPRPADGQLKYVGGETRVVSVPRDINFPELMKKLTNLIEADVVLKYQLIPEDLDALVSVRSDEDLRHMLDEYERHETQAIPRLRAFLFPANPIIIDSQMGPTNPQALEQRYIDAINGIIRATAALKESSINPNYASYGISSACSSPKSPESCTTEAINHQNGRMHMHRVHSSPSLCNLNSQHHHSNHQIHQQNHHHYQNYRQTHQHHHNYQSNKPPIDPHKGFVPEKLLKVRSVGRAESPRYQVDQVPYYYYSNSIVRPNGGSEYCNKCLHFDEYGAYMDRRFDRGDGIPLSHSLPQSPRHTYFGFKAWDGSIAGDN